MTVTFKPMRHHIVVKLTGEDLVTETDSGLAIPEIAQDRVHVGEVVAVGKGKRAFKKGKYLKKRVPVYCEVGDRVWFETEYMGVQVQVDDDIYLVINDDDVSGIVVDDDVSPERLARLDALAQD